MNPHMAVSGAVAGAASGFGFAVVHGLMISAIWFSLPALLIAGALCGLCLGWTYGLLCAVLVLLLGLNISLMGLVFVPADSLFVIAETFGLILALDLVFAVVFAGLERRSMSGRRTASPRRRPILGETGGTGGRDWE